MLLQNLGLFTDDCPCAITDMACKKAYPTTCEILDFDVAGFGLQNLREEREREGDLMNLIVRISPTSTGDLLGVMAKKTAHKFASLFKEYEAVKETIFNVMGVRLNGKDAANAIPQLKTHPEFQYYPALKKGHDLVTLPAGAIIVWNEVDGDGGHISISLGDGTEASDHFENQQTIRKGRQNVWVFMPL